MLNDATDAPLGKVRILKDVNTGVAQNNLKAGEEVAIVASPVVRMAGFTWVQGPVASIRLWSDEYVKIEPAPSC